MSAKAPAVLACAALLWSATVPAASRTELGVRIWPGQAGSDEPIEQELAATEKHPRFLRNVREATVDVYLPEVSPPRGALVVCPGGGFRFLNIDEEGTEVARWLSGQGFAAVVLHYRLKPTPRSDWLFFARMLVELPLLIRGWGINGLKPLATPAIADATQALRYVRGQAVQWRVSSNRVGIIGFSAGGMVALGASLAADARSRPDYTAAFYSGPFDVAPVPADAPPLLAAASLGDPLTPIATQPIASAWAAGGAPVELKLYEGGGHGFGMQPKGNASDRWLNDFADWLERNSSRTLRRGK